MKIWRKLENRFKRRLAESRFKRLLLGEGPRSGPIQLSYREVYILPTAAGFLYGLMLLLMLIASINYSNSLGYLLTFLLSGIVMLAIIHTYRNLCRITLEVTAVEPTFAGSDAKINLVVDNPGPTRYALYARLADRETEMFDVEARGKTRFVLYEPTTRRGLVGLSCIGIHTRYPLGLFRAWAYAHFDHKMLVFPKPIGNALKPSQQSYSANQHGDRGQGVDDFVGLRLFRNGDSFRHVHWKACAHSQHLLTKQFGGDRSNEIWLDFRDFEALPLEKRLSQLCRLVLDAEKEHLDYGLWLPGTILSPAKGEEHRFRCLKALAVFGETA